MREVLFDPIEPIKSGYLKVDDIHDIYWEESGNPKGMPLVFLHRNENENNFPSSSHHARASLIVLWFLEDK